MGLMDLFFGMASGFELRDLTYFKQTFPNGITRWDTQTGQRTLVSAESAIREIQISEGRRVNDGSYRIAGMLQDGAVFPTADMRVHFCDEPARERLKSRQQAPKESGTS